ncbi:hypothetical protein SAMN05216558_2208 [Pseudomonas vancouverensis]|nr:hypothetical protein SAMN05216558_2208 [Pseudomonas vancouverensis]
MRQPLCNKAFMKMARALLLDKSLQKQQEREKPHEHCYRYTFANAD